MRNWFIIISVFCCTLSFRGNSLSISYRHKPANLTEAVNRLLEIVTDTSKQKIKLMTEDEFVKRSHFGLGLSIRNQWGLWKRSRLTKYFNSIGVYHPDDMSAIILTCFYRELQHKDWEVEKQVLYYKNYWNNLNKQNEKVKTKTQ